MKATTTMQYMLATISMRLLVTLLCALHSVEASSTVSDDLLKMLHLPEDAASQNMTEKADVADYMPLMFKMSERSGVFDLTISAKKTMADRISRRRLDVRGNLEMNILQVHKFNLILTINDDIPVAESLTEYAYICDNVALRCASTTHVRQYDSESGGHYDVFDLSFLLRFWSNVHQEYIKYINLSISLHNTSVYELDGKNAPLFLYTEDNMQQSSPVMTSPRQRYARTVESRSPYVFVELEEPTAILNQQQQEPPVFNPGHSPCQKHNWTIAFSDIGWDKWIIAPPGYSLGYCAGSCTEPLNPAEVLSTNHAHVKSLWRDINAHRYPDEAVPPPAHCSPVALSPVTLLFEYEGTIHVRTIQEMVVVECGCL